MLKIVDASIGVKWFVNEPDHDRALEVLEDVFRHPDEFIVPEIFFFEVWNVLSILFRGAPEKYEEKLQMISSAGMIRHPFSDEVFQAGKDFIELGLTAYDASYAALAKLTQGVWITADAKAHKKIAHLKVSKLL